MNLIKCGRIRTIPGRKTWSIEERINSTTSQTNQRQFNNWVYEPIQFPSKFLTTNILASIHKNDKLGYYFTRFFLWSKQKKNRSNSKLNRQSNYLKRNGCNRIPSLLSMSHRIIASLFSDRLSWYRAREFLKRKLKNPLTRKNSKSRSERRKNETRRNPREQTRAEKSCEEEKRAEKENLRQP